MLSCRNSGEDSPSAPESDVINFGMAIGGDYSRAASLVENVNDMQSQPFSVFGDWTDGVQSANIFKDVEVAYDSNTPAGWKYSPIQYWMPIGDYEFRAYWPASNPIAATSNTKTLALEYNMIAQNEDLMVAYKNCPTRSASVNLLFHHALAAVAVKFETKDDDTTYNYKVKNVYFAGLYYSGTLLYDATFENVDLTNSWQYAQRGVVDADDGSNSLHLREWNDDEGRLVPPSAADYPEEFNFFIPQSIKVDDGVAKPIICITASVESDGEDIDMTFNVTLPDTDKDGNVRVWQAGKKYVYIVSGHPSDYSVEVKVTDWDVVNASVEDIQF